VGLSLWVHENPHSIFYPLEAFGYFWQTVAGLLLLPVFTGGGLNNWIRWGYVASFASGVMGLVATFLALSFTDPFFVVGSALWGIGFPVETIAIALWFGASFPPRPKQGERTTEVAAQRSGSGRSTAQTQSGASRRER
jgi:hypothetical protein